LDGRTLKIVSGIKVPKEEKATEPPAVDCKIYKIPRKEFLDTLLSR
jgi:hypothetical protein